MKDLHRLSLRIAGESGQGINASGELLARALKNAGFFTFSYREYPSLIQGGHAFQQIEISDQPLLAPSQYCDVMVCLSRVSLHKYLHFVRPQGKILHSIPRLDLDDEEKAWVEEHALQIEFIDAERMARELGGKRIMANTIMLGTIWKTLSLDLGVLKTAMTKTFADKPDVIPLNETCLQQGYTSSFTHVESLTLSFATQAKNQDDAILSGNHLISLGAIAAGVRAYYAYPMTPSSAILSYLAEMAQDTGMLVKQLDDEISVAQAALGSMFMGTRALCGTSGGGFDLMTETLSLSGMTETPFVVILGQRPGPATGLPTWTAAGDLNLALYAGHGEYPRCVLATSDPLSCYELIQHAFNIAETYQIPVVVLTEKENAESLFQIDTLPSAIPQKRGLLSEEELGKVTSNDRYRLTENGLSPRWVPGQANATYDANSDEHLEDGTLTEEAETSQAMYEKRLRKLHTLENEIPEPQLFGPASADITLIGWGTVKNAVLDAQSVFARRGGPSVNYLHYEYLFPLKTKVFQEITRSARRVILVENNATAQLGGLLTQHTGYHFAEKLLKFDGRPFFVEDILNHLEKN